MAQLNDLLVLGKSVLLGSIKSNADHDLMYHGNEFTFASPGHSGDIYINYRTGSGNKDGAITGYRFADGAGNLAPVYGSTFYGSFSGTASSATALTSSAGSTTLPVYFNAGKPAVITDLILTTTTGGDKKVQVGNSNGLVELLASTNRGIYDRTKSAWIVYGTQDGTHTYIPRWASKGTSTLPVYFNGNGEPVACGTSLAVSITGNAATATTATQLSGNTRMDYGWNGLNYFNISGTAGNAAKTNDTPTSAWWHILRFNHANSSGYYTDLAVPFNATSLYYKRIAEGAVKDGGWVRVLDTLNYTSYVYNKSTSDGRYVYLSGDTMTGKLQLGASAQSGMTQAVGIHVHDLRSTTLTANTFGDNSVNFVFHNSLGASTWRSAIHVKGWTGSYAAWQLSGNAHTTISNKLYYREGVDSTWGSWLSIPFENRANTFTSTNSFNSTVAIQNSTIGGSISFKATKSTDGKPTGILNYYSQGSSSSTDYDLGAFYFTQYSYTDGTFTRLEYYDRYKLPTVAAGKTANATYDILTTKNTITTAQGGTGVTSHTANRLVWSTSATAIQAGHHYANADKIAVNYTSEPSYNFYVSGTSHFTDNTSIAGKLIMTGNIAYTNGGNQYDVIRFVTGDANGAGVVIGGGGTAIFGSGESAYNFQGSSGANIAGTTETTYITSDNNIEFYTNCQTITNRVGVVLNTSRYFYPNVTDTGALGTSSNGWAQTYTNNLYIRDNINSYTGGHFYTTSSTSTTSQESCLIIGNSVADGTAGSRYGVLRIYSTGNAYAQLQYNDVGSYGRLRLTNAKGSYYGILLGAATSGMAVMSQDAAYQGLYNEAKSKWIIQYHGANNTVGINGSHNSSYGVTLNGSVYGTSTLTLANKLIFSGTTAATSQIYFSRDNASYFMTAASGYFCFIPNGQDTGTANADLIISDGAVYPGTTNVTTLGKSGYTWSNVYATQFTGVHKGDILGVTETNPTSATRYNPIFINTGDAAAVSTTEYTRRSNKDFNIWMLEGTASTPGYMWLELGNTVSSGTAGNKYGGLRLYSQKSGYADLVFSSSSTTGRTVTIPDYTGNLIINYGEYNPSSATTLGVGFQMNSGQRRGYNDGMRYLTLQGTTSEAGYGYLILGNATATGTAANKYGALRLYSASSGYINLRATSTTSSYTNYLPASGGTLINNTGATFYGSVYVAGKSSSWNEKQIGVYYSASSANTTLFYMWGNTASGTRGIYDSTLGYVIQAVNGAVQFLHHGTLVAKNAYSYGTAAQRDAVASPATGQVFFVLA